MRLEHFEFIRAELFSAKIKSWWIQTWEKNTRRKIIYFKVSSAENNLRKWYFSRKKVWIWVCGRTIFETFFSRRRNFSWFEIFFSFLITFKDLPTKVSEPKFGKFKISFQTSEIISGGGVRSTKVWCGGNYAEESFTKFRNILPSSLRSIQNIDSQQTFVGWIVKKSNSIYL